MYLFGGCVYNQVILAAMEMTHNPKNKVKKKEAKYIRSFFLKSRRSLIIFMISFVKIQTMNGHRANVQVPERDNISGLSLL